MISGERESVVILGSICQYLSLILNLQAVHGVIYVRQA